MVQDKERTSEMSFSKLAKTKNVVFTCGKRPVTSLLDRHRKNLQLWNSEGLSEGGLSACIWRKTMKQFEMPALPGDFGLSNMS